MTKIFFPLLILQKPTTDLHKLSIMLDSPLIILRCVSFDIPYGEVCCEAQFRPTHCFHFTYRLLIQIMKKKKICNVKFFFYLLIANRKGIHVLSGTKSLTTADKVNSWVFNKGSIHF